MTPYPGTMVLYVGSSERDLTGLRYDLSVYCKYKTEEVFTFHGWIHAE